MLQIVSISQARANLAKLVKQVEMTQQSVVIVQDSKPVVVIQPYREEKSGVLEKLPQSFDELYGFLKGKKKNSFKTEDEVVVESIVGKFIEKESIPEKA